MTRRVQAANQHRLQPRHGQIAAAGQLQPRDMLPGKTDAHRLRRLGPFIELKTTGMQVDVVSGDGDRARTFNGCFAAIAQGIQFDEQIGLGQFLSSKQLQRPSIDLGGHRPALAGKFLLHQGIEIDRKAGDDHCT